MSGHLERSLTRLGSVDGIPLTPAERLALTWLAVLPGFTVADLIRAVRDSRTGTR
jgi:hypothetical protein